MHSSTCTWIIGVVFAAVVALAGLACGSVDNTRPDAAGTDAPPGSSSCVLGTSAVDACTLS